MFIISYAQNGEDVILRRALEDIERGFYIDIGAYDPTDDSVTRAFYDAGWSGINIEPVPEYYFKFAAERPRDVNMNVAIGRDVGLLPFTVISGTGLSTGVADVAKRHAESGYHQRTIVVPSLTADILFDQAKDQSVHFLKVDVEGAEKDVFLGLDLTKNRPWIIVVEATGPGTEVRTDDDWAPLLTKHGYENVFFDGLNAYFLAEEHKERRSQLAKPTNVFDHFVTYKQYVADGRALGQQDRETALEQQLKLEKDRSEHLTLTLVERDQTIQSLVTGSAQRDDHVRWLKSELDARSLAIDARGTELAHSANEATSLKAALAERDRTIQSLSDSGSKRDLDLERSRKQFDQSYGELQRLKGEVDERNRVAETLRFNIAEARQEAEYLRLALAEQKSSTHLLSTRAADEGIKLADIQKDYKKVQISNSDLTKTIAKLKKDLEGCRQQNQHFAGEVKSLKRSERDAWARQQTLLQRLASLNEQVKSARSHVQGHLRLVTVAAGIRASEQRHAARRWWKTLTGKSSHARGHVDSFSGGVVRGWAWDPALPNAELVVRVRIGNDIIGKDLASGYRADLRESGFGSGRCAFEIRVPEGAREKIGRDPVDLVVEAMASKPTTLAILHLPAEEAVQSTLKDLFAPAADPLFGELSPGELIFEEGGHTPPEYLSPDIAEGRRTAAGPGPTKTLTPDARRVFALLTGSSSYGGNTLPVR